MRFSEGANVPPSSSSPRSIFYHYDLYAQLLSKVVRGFQRDVDDAVEFVCSGSVDPERFRALVAAIPDTAYARYPSLSRGGVEKAVEGFLSETS